MSLSSPSPRAGPVPAVGFLSVDRGSLLSCRAGAAWSVDDGTGQSGREMMEVVTPGLATTPTVSRRRSPQTSCSTVFSDWRLLFSCWMQEFSAPCGALWRVPFACLPPELFFFFFFFFFCTVLLLLPPALVGYFF